MNQSTGPKGNTWEISLYIVFLSSILVGALFLLKGNVGLNLSDEGHLWYGVLQTTQGAVPIRDFRSYDPGRYYWAAGLSVFLGSGIIALRVANAVFQIIGLALGLLAVRRVITNKWLLALIGVILVIWMFPRTKLYEHSLAMGAIFFGVFLLEKPSLTRHFVTGIFVGLAAFIGKNLGIYCFISFLCLLLLTWNNMARQFLAKRLAAWTSGIVIGYLPMIYIFVFVPGFLTSFLDSVYVLFSLRTPTLPKPIPWPWTLQFSSLFSLGGIYSATISVMFVIIPIFYLWSILFLLLSKKKDLTLNTSLLTASVFVGIPFMHHAAVRPDVSHLAQSIHPFLIGLTALPFAFRGGSRKYVSTGLTIFIITVTLAVASLWQVGPILTKMEAMFSDNSSYVRYALNGDFVWISKSQADYIQTIKHFVHQYVNEDEEILIVPSKPGMYPILKRTMPIWDPYPLFPVQEERQKQIIESLVNNNVNWAIVSDRALDGMDDRRFSKTHHLVWQYLMKEFVPIDIPGLQEEELLLQRNMHQNNGTKSIHP